MDLFFKEMIVIFIFATIIGYVGYKLKLPLIVSYILAGIIIGPSGINLIQNMHDIEFISELGILLLLFIIGLEFSFLHLVQFKKYIFLGGLLQVTLTIFIFSLIPVIGTELSLNQAVFIGFVTALSSTAIVLKLYQEEGNLDTPHGKLVLGILLFQDLAIIPMLLFLPFLAATQSMVMTDILWLLLKSVLFIGGTFVLGKYIVPQFFRLISETRSQELFFITVLLLFAGMTYGAHGIGLSHGLGAFLAGMMIADSEYSYSTASSILPFRDLFLSFFFISTGMLLRLDILFGYFHAIAVGLILLFVVKFLVVSLVAVALGKSWRVSIIAGYSLFQIGEFSLIMLRQGFDSNLIDGDLFQGFIALIILSMILTPFSIKLGQVIADSKVVVILEKWISLRRKEGKDKETGKHFKVKHHLIVVGYGIIGQSLVRAAKVAGIPYVIIEMNPKTVRHYKKQNEPIILGDATYPHILEEVNIDEAITLALTIPDVQGVLKIIRTVRTRHPDIHIIARTRFTGQVPALLSAGADMIIPEEFEAAIRMFRTVLQFHQVDDEVIELFVRQIRKENYELFLRKGK